MIFDVFWKIMHQIKGEMYQKLDINTKKDILKGFGWRKRKSNLSRKNMFF